MNSEIDELRQQLTEARADFKTTQGALADAQDTIAELRAAAERDRRDGWQPIETAPEGEYILSYWSHDKTIESIQWVAKFYMEVDDMPTHWMPLPKPPAAIAQQPVVRK